MSVVSGQSVTVEFTTRNATTGVGVNADSLPSGTLYVNGTSNAATVTVTNQSTGLYKAQVTLPTLAIADVVSIVIAATVNSVSDKGKIWEDTKDILIDAAGEVDIDMAQAIPASPATNSVGEALLVADIHRGRLGTAQAGGNTSITLDAGASSDSTSYVGYECFLYGGTGGGLPGTGQARFITAYNGSTKVATVDRAWGTNPDATTKYILMTGYIGIDWSKITNPTSSQDFTNTTIKNLDGNTVQTGDAYAYLTTNLGLLGASLSAIPKTGFKLASDGLSAVTAWTVNITGNITGNIIGTLSTLTTYTGNTPQTGDAYAYLVTNLGALGANLTATVTAVWASGTRTLTAFSFTVASNLTQILGTALTETAGQLAAGFKKFFNVASPTSTMNEITLVDTSTNLTNAAANGDLTATMKTSVATAVDASATATHASNADTQTKDTAIRGDLGLGIANLDTQLNAIYTAVGLVEGQTNKLTFDGSNYVKSDPQTLANSGDFNATQKTSITTAASAATPTMSVGNVTVGGYAANQDPAHLVLDAVASSHNTAGTIGNKINSAGNAADPWATDEPGSYPSGTFGYLVSNLPTLVVGALGGATVEYVGAVAPNGGSIELLQGNDYYQADGTQLAWTINGAAYSDWTAGSIAIVLQVGTTVQTVAGVIDTPSGSTRAFHFDVPRAVTSALAAGKGAFQILVTLPTSGHIWTPVKIGTLQVDPKVQ